MSSSPSTPAILNQSVGDQNETGEEESLELLFLGCESKPPYGPYLHTATLFLKLVCQAIQESLPDKNVNVAIKVFSLSQGNFPGSQDFENCDGVILPGSFNSAYDTDDWIIQLKQVIQQELVAKQRPTLGVCFGHQLYSHSFEETGGACKCPAGPQAGRKSCKLTKAGLKFLKNDNSSGNLDLYYTHGDMVEKLPPQGMSLGGNDKVPIQAAIYFADDTNKSETPIAVTFQAHPEYASSKELGVDQTLGNIMKAMEERGDITPSDRELAQADANTQFDMVESDSIQVMVAAGKALGWF